MMLNTMVFTFEGNTYSVAVEAMVSAGDVVKLPDGRYLEIACFESNPPQVKSIRVVDGPSDVPSPSGFGKGHKGKAWDATAVS